MGDKVLQCKDCGDEFVFTERDQEFYQRQGFQEPKRCKPCRERKKRERAEHGGGNEHSRRRGRRQ